MCHVRLTSALGAEQLHGFFNTVACYNSSTFARGFYFVACRIVDAAFSTGSLYRDAIAFLHRRCCTRNPLSFCGVSRPFAVLRTFLRSATEKAEKRKNFVVREKRLFRYSSSKKYTRCPILTYEWTLLVNYTLEEKL